MEWLLTFISPNLFKALTLSDSWDKWVDFAIDNIEIEIDDGEYNENSERDIMSNYLANSDLKAIVGQRRSRDGKTYFAMKFCKILPK